MHILVLGAAGMVGRKLVDRLIADGRLGNADITRLTLQDVVAPVKPASIPVETVTGGIAFPVRISLDPAGSRLFVGMTGSADIEVTSIPEALTVPVEAVLTEGPVRSVFVLGADGKAHKTAIQIGAANDTHAQVLSGLDAGAVVVTSQLTALTDGQSVTSL